MLTLLFAPPYYHVTIPIPVDARDETLPAVDWSAAVELDVAHPAPSLAVDATGPTLRVRGGAISLRVDATATTLHRQVIAA